MSLDTPSRTIIECFQLISSNDRCNKKQRLRGYNVPFNELCSKAELLELALANSVFNRNLK